MVMACRCTILASAAVLLSAWQLDCVLASSKADTSTSKEQLQFTSPIQSYTIFDKSVLSSPDYASQRRKFLPRFRTGIMAERITKQEMMDEQRRGIGLDEDTDVSSGSWAEASAAADERKKKAKELRLESSFDAAVEDYDQRVSARRSASPGKSGTSASKYQFVGVVNDAVSGKGKVTWYARNKPRNSKWNVRLVHVNRDAVLKDMFVKGKIDIYGKYTNKGIDEAAAFAAAETSGGDAEGETEQPGMKPLIQGEYTVKERSWKTLWNFSPIRMFTTPSGSFWRERRISPGIYTDGADVYESVYRFRDGKNGLKRTAKLEKYLDSPSLSPEKKNMIIERLKGGGTPDIVIEK